MKNELVAISCRICLTQTKRLRSLYKPIDEGDEPPNEMLELVAGIKVEKMDEHVTLPKRICKHCEQSLSMAFEFRLKALKTQQIIVAYLKELNENDCTKVSSGITSPNLKAATNYQEIKIDLEPINSIVILDEDIKDCKRNTLKHKEGNETSQDEENFIQQQEQSYLETEFEGNEEYYSDRHQRYDNDQQRMYDDNEEDETMEEEYERDGENTMTDEEQDSTDNQEICSKINDSKLKAEKVSKMYVKIEKSLQQNDNINKVKNVKQIARRGRKPTNSSYPIGYICDVCGNVFAKRGRMMEHRQRHEKDLKYACELCDEKFHMRELLRKHMFSHSGGKPLKCEYCSRTFYYESTRKAHEAVHKGYKPYVCDDCGKAFGYAHSLKKHKLIHAEIKLYRCEYCNKDFRLQHHMKQHELTRLHRNAVSFANSGRISNEDGDDEADPYEIIPREQDLNDDILFIEELEDEQLASGS